MGNVLGRRYLAIKAVMRTIRGVAYLLVSGHDITEMYPDPVTKPLLPKRARGFLAVDTYKCNLCGACKKICPSKSIELDLNNLALNIDYTRCMYCGYCSVVCPESALSFSKEFEGATNNKDIFQHGFSIINIKDIKKEKEQE
jgi:formate hydrogenlyase subunit 6/NADH:ubiquinone oxidoreductase subunit I